MKLAMFVETDTLDKDITYIIYEHLIVGRCLQSSVWRDFLRLF